MLSPIHQAFEALVPRQSSPTIELPLHTRGPTNAPRILAIVGFLTGLSALLVVLRYYVRLFILRRFDIEDGIILISQACAFGVLACFVGETHHGLGHYSIDIGLEDFEPLSKWTFFHAIVIVLGISAVKISLAFFLLRFTSHNTFIKRFIIGALVFLILFTIACVLTLIFQCLPVSAAWDFAQKATATCYSPKTYLAIGEFNSAINIATDFVFATLPVFMFYNIQVNKRTRASLMGILSLGYLACAAAIAKTVYQSRVFDEKDAWRDPKFLIWNCVELNVGIIAACFPTIKPLVKSVIGSTWSLASNSRSRKRTNNAYYGQSSSHALGSMRRSRLEHEAQKYNVHIDADRTSLSASEGGSEENLASRPPHLQRLSSSRILRTTECSTGAMGDAARLPVLAPASVGTPRVVEISTFEHRRHIAVTACSECRAKKRKCSGKSPCTACVSLGIECLLDSDRRLVGTKRRGAEMKSKNLTLKKKVQSLENETRSSSRHLPGLPRAHAGAYEMGKIRYEPSETCARHVQGTVSTDSVEQTGTDSVSVLKDSSSDRSAEDWNSIWAIFERVRNSAPADLFKVVNAIRSSSDPTLAAQYLQQVSLGQLADALVGLSNLAAEYKLISSPRLPALCEEPILFAPAKPWTTVTDSDRLVSHLLSLYFTWDYPCYTWFDQHLFLADMIAGQSRFCSPLLVNAVLANACLYSYSLRRPWDRFKEMDMCIRFLSEARQLWISHPQPTLTSIQALIVMNLTYNCLGKDKIGWSCLAAAIQMANELKLYEPLSGVRSAGSVEPAWNRAHAVTAWGLFEWQALAASVVDDSPRLDHPPFYEIPYSNAEVLDHSQRWHPYPFSGPLYPSRVFSTVRARFELSAVINDVTEFILDSRHAVSTVESFMLIHERLANWYIELSPALHPSKNAPPHIFIMHLHFHLGVVALCRPILSSGGKPSPSVLSISNKAKLATREIIFLFKQTFGWKSASNFLNHALTYGAFNAIPFAKDGDPRWRQSLETCISGLWYISFSFPVCRYLFRAIQHTLVAAGFADTDLCPEVTRILRYFTRNVWKKSLLETLESRYPSFDPQNNLRTVEDLLQSVESLALNDRNDG
ncbi:hypothetical protein CNMCM5623_009836 [Aspergillus felis]|uniref:Zn(2)-C6 fungal-type domain-containing protein n=1 Tax=Aspergillus felis TaxID=1287682 RepID=A0A8H6Q4Z1_9EURO|nr:hypothetical protein CNMCM5623_009836 [Aspergillus felis]